ncbi:hypothetical protein ACFE04_021532 [Oxalis oulophora]
MILDNSKKGLHTFGRAEFAQNDERKAIFRAHNIYIMQFRGLWGCDANEIAVAKLSAATPVNITYNFTTAARRLYIPSDEGENERKIFDDRAEIYARHQPFRQPNQYLELAKYVTVSKKEDIVSDLAKMSYW